MHPLRRMAVLSIATSLVTLALKFGAYALTGSVGLLSDALETFVNLAAGLVAFGALTIAARPADENHAYGHDKAEYFASGVEGGLILFAAGAIVYTALPRFWHPVELDRLGPGMLVSLAAAMANYATARIMLKVAHEHDSIAIEADARHLLTDVWTTLGVIGGLIVVWAVPSWRVLDPVMAIAVALHIVFTGLGLLRRSADGLMDAALPTDEIQRIEAAIVTNLPSGASHQALRTRKAGARRFIQFTLLVTGEASVRDAHRLCDRLEAAVGSVVRNATVSIHVEPRAEE